MLVANKTERPFFTFGEGCIGAGRTEGQSGMGEPRSNNEAGAPVVDAQPLGEVGDLMDGWAPVYDVVVADPLDAVVGAVRPVVIVSPVGQLRKVLAFRAEPRPRFFGALVVRPLVGARKLALGREPLTTWRRNWTWAFCVWRRVL